MTDIRNSSDFRSIDIDRVGIKNLIYPIVLRDRTKELQQTTATINFYADLPKQFKGTHMSRFVEVLNEMYSQIDVRRIDEILNRLKSRLEASTAHIEISFPYFVMKSAPVSGSKGFVGYKCTISASSDSSGERSEMISVQVPLTAVCPCSKESADRGAHNQRSDVTVTAEINEFIWLEEIISIVEKSGSYEIFTHLKREDEKFITEHAYDNPTFVEDIVRNVADELRRDSRIDWFTVEAENYESIHSHNAYASIHQNLARNRQSSSRS